MRERQPVLKRALCASDPVGYLFLSPIFVIELPDTYPEKNPIRILGAKKRGVVLNTDCQPRNRLDLFPSLRVPDLTQEFLVLLAELGGRVWGWLLFCVRSELLLQWLCAAAFLPSSVSHATDDGRMGPPIHNNAMSYSAFRP